MSFLALISVFTSTSSPTLPHPRFLQKTRCPDFLNCVVVVGFLFFLFCLFHFAAGFCGSSLASLSFYFLICFCFLVFVFLSSFFRLSSFVFLSLSFVLCFSSHLHFALSVLIITAFPCVCLVWSSLQPCPIPWPGLPTKRSRRLNPFFGICPFLAYRCLSPCLRPLLFSLIQPA